MIPDRTLVLAAFALMLALAPGAAAQLPSTTLFPATLAASAAAPAAPLPQDATVRVPYRVEYAVGGPHAGTLTVTLSPGAIEPGWSVALEPAEHAVSAAPSAGATYVLEGHVVLRHDGTPRAFDPRPLVLDVHAPGDGLAVGPAYTELVVLAAADWRPGLYVTVAAPTLRLNARAVEDVVTAEVRNTGNADAVVRAEALRAPRGCTPALRDAPTRLAPDERGVLTVALDCERGWKAGTVTLRLQHALAADPAREGVPVEPQWDLVPVDADELRASGWSFGGGSGGASRSYGDPPVGSNEASWGAVVLVPASLALAALLVRRR